MNQLTDSQLWQCMTEADERRMCDDYSIDERVRSFETYVACLREAWKRGYTYAELKAKVLEAT